MMPCEWAYWPVRKLARLGEHRGVVTNALRKVTPSRAMRSTFGVLAKGCPVQPSSSQRRSSIRMKTMLGRGAAALRATPARAAAPRVIHWRLDGDRRSVLVFTEESRNTYHTIRASAGLDFNSLGSMDSVSRWTGEPPTARPSARCVVGIAGFEAGSRLHGKLPAAC